MSLTGRASGWSARGVALVALFSAFAPAGQAEAGACARTPEQTEGPYYPAELGSLPAGGPQQDLSRMEPQGPRAEGLLLYLHGRVLDARCRPIPGAIVEIWQVSANGRYDHPRDRRNPAPLDPAFRYWAKAATDADGRFRIKTIKPGPYQAGRGWTRPSHLHVKVRGPSLVTLTTQLYFQGDPHHAGDYILEDIPPGARGRVITTLEPPAAGMEPEARLAHVELVVDARAERQP